MALMDRQPAPWGVTQPAAGRLTVLVVDDDPLIRRLTRMALTSAGFDVLEAPDGAEALDIVREQRCSLVLLDGQMPVLSGREVLQRLRANAETATLPVIMVTADVSVTDRLSGLAAGADDYLTKPFSLDEMVARVRAHLRAHDAWRETLAAHERSRSALARALDIAGRQPSLEGSASVLCHALAGQPEVQAAAILRFTAEGNVVTVATSGPSLWGLATGDAAPPPLRSYLHDRAVGGPWIEPGPSGACPGGIRPQIIDGSGNAVACAPLADEDAVHGLLLVQLPDRHGASAVEPSVALAAAIDFASVTHGLLRRRLVEQADVEKGRMEVRAILSARAFHPVFQPIVDLSSGATVGTEALTRFTDGSDTETRFREAAGCGLGTDLELATIDAALHDALALAPEFAWISLNVSPALLLSQAAALSKALRARRRDVVLELSEQEAVTDYDAVRDVVGSLGTGLRLSIDDAGSGFASLRHILYLRPDFVKLDRSWVHDVDVDPARQALIAGLRHFADQTGARLVAEGIEREAELDTLVGLRVDLGQGYLLGRPEMAQ